MASEEQAAARVDGAAEVERLAPALDPSGEVGHRPARQPGRQSALDGVRAVAIAGVLGFHAHVPGFGGGTTGVTVFFVLSGFLISTLLMAEYDRTGTIDLRAFYARRAARLLPALGAVLLASFCFYAPEVGAPKVARYAAPVICYVANLVLASGRSVPFFTYTWTLSTEEQFYTLWPLVLRRQLRRDRLRALGAACLALVVAAELLRLGWVAAKLNPAFVEYSPFTQGDALLYGVVAALWWRHRSARSVRRPAILAAVSLAAIAVGFTIPGVTSESLLSLPLVSVATAVLLPALLAQPAGLPSRLLGCWPLAYLGRISYGIYLWNVLLYEIAGRAHRQPAAHGRDRHSVDARSRRGRVAELPRPRAAGAAGRPSPVAPAHRGPAAGPPGRGCAESRRRVTPRR